MRATAAANAATSPSCATAPASNATPAAQRAGVVDNYPMATNTYVNLPRMKEAQALADYTGIYYDLLSARQFAELYLQEWLKQQRTADLLDALMTATVIRYARSFVGG